MKRVRAVALAAAVAASALALQNAGEGVLAAPPLLRPARWSAWLAGREPIEAALALVRLGAVAALWYLAVAAGVGLGLRVVRAHRLVAVADRVTIPVLRRLLAATAGVSLVSGVGPALLLAGRAPVAAAMVAPDGAASTTSTTDGRTDPTLTMRLLPADAAPPPSPAPAPPVPQGSSAIWTVVAGECFWSIAEDVLTQEWGRAPSDAEIVPYWRVLIEANRQALADPTNEDLIFPGQAFAVPPPPPRG